MSLSPEETQPLMSTRTHPDDAEAGALFSDPLVIMEPVVPWWQKYRVILLILVVIIGVLVVALIITLAVGSSDSDDDLPATTTPKNVILLITDGFGPASVTLSRTLNGAPLALDFMVRGTIRTKSADSLVTDSAAGATAYSCGLKTNNTFVAVDPHGVPCGTILEAAQKKGMRTGLVVTCRITDATPAAFSSHSISRYNQELIALQQVKKGVDIMLGGGRDYFLPSSEGGLRTDGLNLLNISKAEGVTVATTLAEFNAISEMPVLGLFAMSNLDYTIDKNTEQPTLAQMTAKALGLLSKNSPNGFFLMVEGSRIDHSGHDNDAAAHFREVLAYNDALQEVISFAESDSNTLVVSVSDHETGGLALGRTPRNGGYPVYAWYPEVVARVTASAAKMAPMIQKAGNLTQQLAMAQTVLSEFAGFNVTQEELNLITPALQNPPQGIPLLNVIGNLIAYRAGLAWTTLGHTGVDINLYSYTKSPTIPLPGVVTTTEFGNGGNMENTDLGNFLIRVGKFDVSGVTQLLKRELGLDSLSQYARSEVDQYHPSL
jgi:alkaline phosphatase